MEPQMGVPALSLEKLTMKCAQQFVAKLYFIPR